MAYKQDGAPLAVRLAVGVLIAGLALLTAHNWLHVGWPAILPATWWDWLYNALEIGAAALCATRALSRRDDRAAWSAMAIGLALFAAGDMYYSLAWGDANSVPVPSIADGLYLSFYPAVYVGIVLLLQFMKRHTIVGERIVASATSLHDVAPIIRSSHERWDGRGYPDGLAGDAIPLGARVIAVCDAYDAMTMTRPYRDAMSEASAMAELRRCAGEQFDARVVAAFESVIARKRAAAREQLAA